MAASQPAYLGEHENFSITGGLGFSDGGDTAVGITGMVRLDKNWAGYVGGAVSSDGDTAGAKAGLRVGW